MPRKKRYYNPWGQGGYEFDKWLYNLAPAEGQNAYQAQEAYNAYTKNSETGMQGNAQNNSEAGLQNTFQNMLSPEWEAEHDNAQAAIEQGWQQQSQGLNGPTGRPQTQSPHYKEFIKEYAFKSRGSITLDVSEGYGTTGWFTQTLKLVVSVARSFYNKNSYILHLSASSTTTAIISFNKINYWISINPIINGTEKKEINHFTPFPQGTITEVGYVSLGYLELELPNIDIESYYIRVKSSYNVDTGAGFAGPIKHPLAPLPTQIDQTIKIYTKYEIK